jgi:hypothetical protein
MNQKGIRAAQKFGTKLVKRMSFILKNEFGQYSRALVE